MATQLKMKRDWRALSHLGAAGVGVAVMAAWLLFGQTGLFAWSDYNRTLDQRRQQLASIEQRHRQLLNHRDLLNPAHVDPDFGEEIIREQFDLVHPDDIIVPLPRRR